MGNQEWVLGCFFLWERYGKKVFLGEKGAKIFPRGKIFGMLDRKPLCLPSRHIATVDKRM